MLSIILLSLIILLAIHFNDYKIDKPFVLFSIFYFMVYPFGYFLIFLINIFEPYKLTNDLIDFYTPTMLYAYLIVALCSSSFNFLISKIKVPQEIDKLVSFKTIVLSRKVFLIIGLIGLILFISKNGIVLLKVMSGGYSEKNYANAGSGVYNILISYGFNLYIVSRLIHKPSQFYSTAIIALIIGTVLFFVMGGGRASSLMLIAAVLLAGFYYGHLSLKVIFLASVTFFLLIIIMTIVRYQVDLTNIDDRLIASVIYKIQGSFSPIDSFIIIANNVSTASDFQPNVMFNNAYYFVPRVLWEDKPLILENAAGYYTKQILHYGSDVTISPSLLGELFLYGGHWGICIGMVVVSVIISLFTSIYSISKNIVFMRLIYFMIMLNFFGMMREGVALLIRDLVFFAIVFSFFIFIALLYRQVILRHLINLRSNL